MGCTPSRYEEIDRYTIFDEYDRDDFDEGPCGCGPWYGGENYRKMRRRYLPGYGSPPGNYYGRGGYAGMFSGGGIYGGSGIERDIQIASAQTQMGMVPYRPQSQVIVPAPIAPIQQVGYLSEYNGGYPYQRPAMW